MDDFYEYLKINDFTDAEIQKLRDEAIDARVVPLMTDEQLERFVPTYGRRVIVLNYFKKKGGASKAQDEGVELITPRVSWRFQYFTDGPNFIWHVKSYDILKKYGICINGCVDGFSRKVIWLRAGQTSGDPEVIAGYYVEAVRETGGCPRFLRSDLCTENSSLAPIHERLRYNTGDKDTFFCGSSPHNRQIAAWWGILRKECVNCWIDAFQMLVDNGNFTGSFLDKNLVLFCFLRLIQKELDSTVNVWNTHPIRSGYYRRSAKPISMYTLPQNYNTHDSVCHVEPAEFDNCVGECTFPTDVPCDADMYELCNITMEEMRLSLPDKVAEAVVLYVTLRKEIHRNMPQLHVN